MRKRCKNEFYVSDDCRENMHGTEIYIPGCKWFDMKTKKTNQNFRPTQCV
jgi:hypothetical protein